jgi:hypothetical protein
MTAMSIFGSGDNAFIVAGRQVRRALHRAGLAGDAVYLAAALYLPARGR